MCGRFTLTIEAAEVQLKLGLGQMPPDWLARYNIAPSQNVAVVKDAGTRDVSWMRWGLIPFWAKDPKIGYRMINARSETVHEKPSFRRPFHTQRCLILADGFYEWKKRSSRQGGSIPHYFRLQDGEPFAFAGLWDVWRPKDAEPVVSCTIITCPANEIVSPVHERMPVILDTAAIWDWLQLDSASELRGLLRSYPAQAMDAFQVSRMVNSPNVDEEKCIVPVAG